MIVSERVKMPQSYFDPTLDVAGDEIMVTLRGTSYAVSLVVAKAP